jgi:hypothetical protein
MFLVGDDSNGSAGSVNDTRSWHDSGVGGGGGDPNDILPVAPQSSALGGNDNDGHGAGHTGRYSGDVGGHGCGGGSHGGDPLDNGMLGRDSADHGGGELGVVHESKQRRRRAKTASQNRRRAYKKS